MYPIDNSTATTVLFLGEGNIFSSKKTNKKRKERKKNSKKKRGPVRFFGSSDETERERERERRRSIRTRRLTWMWWTGNLLTMVALLRSRKLRQHATTAFVLSLAAADLIFCAFNLPLTASRYIHQAWIFGDTLCRLFPFFFYGNVAASVLSMVLITVNR